MDRKTLKALKGSIKKWEKIVAGKEEDMGNYNCPLCHEFLDKDCRGCPVKKATGKVGCDNSPYELWKFIPPDETEQPISDIAKIAARAEVMFLESLLPKKKLARRRLRAVRRRNANRAR